MIRFPGKGRFPIERFSRLPSAGRPGPSMIQNPRIDSI